MGAGSEDSSDKALVECGHLLKQMWNSGTAVNNKLSLCKPEVDSAAAYGETAVDKKEVMSPGCLKQQWTLKYVYKWNILRCKKYDYIMLFN
jgi:hypothetical protein